MILGGAGVGGGSLNYANTLYKPLAPFFADPQWAHITDWRDELEPHYDQAQRMLGVTMNTTVTEADKVLKSVADDMGVGHTYTATPVGVLFGGADQPPGAEVDDPFFGGAGPKRNTCLECGSCMTGCRFNAKNTLDKNYLYLAERNGCVVHPMTTVVDVEPLPDGGYAVHTVTTGRSARRRAEPAHLHRRAGRVLGQHVQHAEAAAPAARQRLAAEHLRPARPTDPYQLRVHPGRQGTGQESRLHRGRGDHVLDPHRRAHAHRAGALRQGQQRDGAASDRAHRR
nr:hypothetical protein GCM10020092_104420 [Actinoplanes digitatis]